MDLTQEVELFEAFCEAEETAFGVALGAAVGETFGVAGVVEAGVLC